MLKFLFLILVGYMIFALVRLISFFFSPRKESQRGFRANDTGNFNENFSGRRKEKDISHEAKIIEEKPLDEDK